MDKYTYVMNQLRAITTEIDNLDCSDPTIRKIANIMEKMVNMQVAGIRYQQTHGLEKELKSIQSNTQLSSDESDLARRGYEGLRQAEVLRQALNSFRCQYTQDNDGEGMPLVDLLSPGDATIVQGKWELDHLADYLADHLEDSGMSPHTQESSKEANSLQDTVHKILGNGDEDEIVPCPLCEADEPGIPRSQADGYKLICSQGTQKAAKTNEIFELEEKCRILKEQNTLLSQGKLVAISNKEWDEFQALKKAQ